MPCLFVSLQSAVDCAVWKKRSTLKVIAPWNKRLEQSLQCARSKVPYKWKNSRSPSSQENFIYHVTFWPTVRSMKAVLSLGRNTCLLLYIWYSGRESITIVRNKFHRNSLLDLNFFNPMEFTIIGTFNFEWAFYPSATTKYPTRKRYQRKKI